MIESITGHITILIIIFTICYITIIVKGVKND